MAKFQASRVLIREFPDVTVIFYDAKTIRLYPYNGNQSTIFHSWYAPLFFYRDHWLPFRKALLRHKTLDTRLCYELARRYDIPYQISRSPVNLTGKKVEVSFGKYAVIGQLK